VHLHLTHSFYTLLVLKDLVPCKWIASSAAALHGASSCMSAPRGTCVSSSYSFLFLTSPDDGDQNQNNTADIALNEEGSLQNCCLVGLLKYFLFLRFTSSNGQSTYNTFNIGE
jgi:hypothetical protein